MTTRRPHRLNAWLRTCRGLVAATPLLLAACGGGGGGDGVEPPTQPYNLDSAITRALQTPFQIGNLTARDAQGNLFTLSLAYAPAPDAVFEGALRKSATQTVTISGGGNSTSQVSTSYYTTAPYREIGSTADDGSYMLSVRTGDLPTAALVGGSGPLSTDTGYTDSSKAVVDATAVSSWALEADSATSAYACMKSTVTMVSPPEVASQSLCFRINAAGDVLGGRVSITASGITLDFR